MSDFDDLPGSEVSRPVTPQRKNPPFEKFTFTLVQDRLGRKLFRMKLIDDGYELHVERGSASNPSSQFTRVVPQETAQKFKDALDILGVFSWDEKYGDAVAPGKMRWSVNTVFKEGVFSVASKGGSDVPAGFESLLEEMYRLDFPRPDAGSSASAKSPVSPIGKTSAASSAISNVMRQSGLDMSALPEGMASAFNESLGNLSSADALDALSQMRRNPQEMQQRLKDEFNHMSPDEQNKMLDALASTGMASRAWWERFFRGL
jgi:hypothetical protein